MDFYSNYEPHEGVYHLKHYGVLGMKWGVRHDPDPVMQARINTRVEKYGQSPRRAARIEKRIRKKDIKRLALLHKNGKKLEKKYPEKVQRYKKLKEKNKSIYANALDKYRTDKKYRKEILDNIGWKPDIHMQTQRDFEIVDEGLMNIDKNYANSTRQQQDMFMELAKLNGSYLFRFE